ncbi:hypothetical protein PHLCEN_2v1097 [Hermanssonia centrifuga]|uniref:Uncharacterized protein n=1 Tax=Hermanssonia centrifuga TaxID=98765 RepID=A0A2R6S449_9APHY|nr:hypothetical protein PHLCEN_2v1097 [Hermanssonia centrifuga]
MIPLLISAFVLGIFFDNVYHDLPTTCLHNVAIARTGYYYDVLIPSVSLCHPTDAVRANFGHEPFRYPIGRIMRDSSRKTQWPRSPKPQSLPSEVISTILKFAALAPRKEGIAWAALVCRYWYRRCLPYLFKSIALRSKSDMDILYALVTQRPRTHILGPSITDLDHHLALEETHSEVWAYGVAVSLANRLPHLLRLEQRRDYSYWELIQSRTPPRISTSLPALYSAYKAVTTFSLTRYHFRSFAAFTQLVSALPVLETLKCKDVTWNDRPDNPRLLRAPLSRIEVYGAAAKSRRMIQLFTIGWGSWKPTPKYPVLGCYESKLIKGLVDMEDLSKNQQGSSIYSCNIHFATFVDKWHFTIEGSGNIGMESTWDLALSPRVTHDSLTRACLTNLSISRPCIFRNHLDEQYWAKRVDTMFSKTPLFLEDVTITWKERRATETTLQEREVETSKLRSLFPRLQQTGKLQFIFERKK